MQWGGGLAYAGQVLTNNCKFQAGRGSCGLKQMAEISALILLAGNTIYARRPI